MHCQIADETKILQIYKIQMIDTSGQRQEPMHLVLNEDDLAFEEEILRNPHSIKPWIRYIGKQELLVVDNASLYCSRKKILRYFLRPFVN